MQNFYQEMPEPYMRMIRKLPEMTEAVWRWDCSLYDTMILTFLPTVHHPLPPETIRSLRTYTRELKEYLETCLTRFPPSFFQKKSDVARIFAAKFRRQLSLNFAAQTASSVLNSPDCISVMIQDWNNFDVDSILDQTLWVCDCDTTEIRHICKAKKKKKKSLILNMYSLMISLIFFL
ncbi:uncharacterized protein BX663DRAFT_430333 [Cokeromyces recurvatus]|uniref:uncharacterized protein n=1 Tax=Cokeromyces recurvatus TaxID=90255 RepID=UPI00221F5692|nr:uncharacterized protein BX663DRAFT_430333 [Cokeromyces recurvatus]KAI7905245.1 hypothetical protein BX663DRAFT_430333 [Cokeromyces recurvatus]